ncbi:hypothetical protein E2320_017842 [Naja naja]|nr:hypothetical protein E2320_017842 [Naja naja]
MAAAAAAGAAAPAVPVLIHRLAERLLRSLSHLLDRAPPGKGWRDLAQLAGSRVGLRLSPSWSLLQLMGERGCTVSELTELLHSLQHTEALQLLNPIIKIVVEPESQAVFSGQMVKLSCWATGYPLLYYQWFKEKKMVPNGNSPELIFNQVTAEDVGLYICRVNSDSSYEFSQWAQLDVCDSQRDSDGNYLKLPEKKIHIYLHPQSQNLTVSCVDIEHQGTYWCRVYNNQENEESRKVKVTIEELNDLARPAVDKVALLMGNMSYYNHPKLKAPLVDVYELTNLLRQLDFKVVSLLDLTEPEMRNAVDEFLLLLDKGVYGLLYYAGHGYENYGNSFMVPIDAPNPYRAANCLCVQNILKLMQEKDTGLNVFLLDMCRKRNEYDNTVLVLDALKVTANIVFGYATCQGAEAFEIQQSGLANGIFMKFLKERLLEDKKITVLLDGVAEDMGKCHLTKGKQALEIRSSLSEKRALTDPIQQTVTSAEALARNLQWAKAHELSESMYLQFQCGVRIQLGFAAEFSNVMIIYTRIVKKPPEITVCNAYVTDFPLDPVDEQKAVNIGKPLVARLRIHQGFGKCSCFQSCSLPNGASSAQSLATEASGFCPSHLNQPHSYTGFVQSGPSLIESLRQPPRCHCRMVPDRLVAWQSKWSHSYNSDLSNIPVETTDELESDFSGSLKLSHEP